MSDTRHVEGWWLVMGAVDFFWDDDDIPKPGPDDKKATLTIHKGERERVLTESEVTQIVQEALAQCFLGGDHVPKYSDAVTAFEQRGIILKP